MPTIISFASPNILVWVWMSNDSRFQGKFSLFQERDAALLNEEREVILNAMFAVNTNIEISDDVRLASVLLYEFAHLIVNYPQMNCFDSTCNILLGLHGVDMSGVTDDGIGLGIYVIDRKATIRLDGFYDGLKYTHIERKN